MLKEINGFPDYYVNKKGQIFSRKRGDLKEIAQWADGKGRYLLVHIIDATGKPRNILVHRIVAIAFIDNPMNLPEVNHKDNNPQNSNVDNLEWCDRITNLKQSYETMSPVRNYTECKLYKSKRFIKSFISIREAAKFASNNYEASFSSLNKYHQCGDLEITTENAPPTGTIKFTRKHRTKV